MELTSGMAGPMCCGDKEDRVRFAKERTSRADLMDTHTSSIKQIFQLERGTFGIIHLFEKLGGGQAEEFLIHLASFPAHFSLCSFFFCCWRQLQHPRPPPEHPHMHHHESVWVHNSAHK